MPRNRVAGTLTERIRNCYEQQFTGLIKVTEHTDKPWYVYFLLGRIIWAQSSDHPLRSWKRQLAVHSPVLSEQINEPVSLYYEYWNYAALSRLVKLKQFPREQFSKVVEGCITEVLFDILQMGIWQLDEAGELTIEEQKKEAASMPFIMLENLQSWSKAQHDWQRWEQAGLTKLSPNWAPTIRQPEELKAQTPLQTFQTLTSFANGENTLRDLAIKFKQPIIPIAKSIQPYVGRKLLEFIEIPDIVDSAHHGFHPEMMEVHQAPSDTDSERETTNTEQFQRDPPLSTQPPDDPPNQRASDQEAIDNRGGASNQPTTQASSNENLEAKDSLAKEPTVKRLADLEAQSEELAKQTANKAPVSNRKPANTEPANTESDHKGQRSKELASKEKTSAKETSEAKSGDKPLVTASSVQKASVQKHPAKELPSELQEGLVYQKQSKPAQVVEQGTEKTPQAAVNPQQNASATKSSKPTAKRKAGKSLPKVIYIDDSPADSRAMASIVEKLGYQYINIPDPLQALPTLIELKPKLIFLDLVMPIANGYEVCAQIRRITAFKKTPVIIVTSNDGIADRVRAKIVGASGFMGKPIQEKRILKVFKKHLPAEISQ